MDHEPVGPQSLRCPLCTARILLRANSSEFSQPILSSTRRSTTGRHHRELPTAAKPPLGPVGGCGASADNSPCSAADASPVTLVSDGKPLQIKHLCFMASRSSVRQGVFSGPKSPDAPEPVGTRPTNSIK